MGVTEQPSRSGKPAGILGCQFRQHAAGRMVPRIEIFNPPIDLTEFDALGVWIYGDGQGELLNFQLTNPIQFWPTFNEHYVKVDFQGWRYFELLCRERNADRYADYVWPYQDTSGVYRSPLIHDHVSALNIWYNCLPPGREAICCLGPVKALRTVKTRVKNPAIKAGGNEILFPVVLESGSSLEFGGGTECSVFDERGKLLQNVHVNGPTPVLATGDNRMEFRCEAVTGLQPRAKITAISTGVSIGNIPATPGTAR